MNTNDKITTCNKVSEEYHKTLHGVHLCVTFAEKENPEVLNHLRALLLSACKEQLAPASRRN